MVLSAALGFDLALALVIWRMVRQARAFTSLTYRDPEPSIEWPRIGVIVPARNEAPCVAGCIRSLLDQDYPAEQLSVRLVDDGSEDGTGMIGRAAANGDPRFSLVEGAKLLPGWTGKSFACWQGACASQHVEFLCFVDADTVAEPKLLRACVLHATSRGTELISLEPFQELGSVVERLIMPCGLYMIAASQDVRLSNSPSHPKAAANGQFILVRKSAYEQIGGHSAVRAEICEDAALARRAKRAGLRYELLGAEAFIRTRMYRDWSSLWTGLSKNASELAGGPLQTVLIAGAGLVMSLAGFFLTALALLDLHLGMTAPGVASVGLSVLGLAAIISLHLVGTRHFDIPYVYGLLFPIGYGLAFALALDSARRAYLGRVAWKGRTYVQPRPTRDESDVLR